MRMHDTLRCSGASGCGNHKGIASVDLTTIEMLFGAIRLNEASGGEGSNEGGSGGIRKARVEGHGRVAAFPDR